MKSLPKNSITFLLFIFLAHSLHAAQLHGDLNTIDHINNLFETALETENTQDVPIVKHVNKATQPKKDWTLMIYISADNDLRNFAIRNIKQMTKVGSNHKKYFLRSLPESFHERDRSLYLHQKDILHHQM